MSTYKTRRHIVDAEGNYNVVYEETSSDLVMHSDGTTAADHIDNAGIHMTSAEKDKLGGIAENANNYTHPATSGNKHIPSGGSSGQILRWSADGTAEWGDDNDTTYSNMTAATASAAGKAGLVPAPAAGKQASFLRGDGTWATPADTNTDTKVSQNRSGTASYRPLLLHYNYGDYGVDPEAVTNTVYYNETIAAKPSTGELKATTFTGELSGNASTATKWATARNINGMSVDGSADRNNYGTCSTAAATAAKTVACTGFALVTGAEITVKFTVTNTAANPTLNVNSTGAKAIYYRGAAISAGYLAANRTYTFRYNGTQYELVGDINTDTNTTYTLSSITGTLAVSKGGTGATTAPLGLYALINGSSALTSSGLAEGDYVALGDVSATTGKKVTLANLYDWMYNKSALVVTYGDTTTDIGYTIKEAHEAGKRVYLYVPASGNRSAFYADLLHSSGGINYFIRFSGAASVYYITMIDAGDGIINWGEPETMSFLRSDHINRTTAVDEADTNYTTLMARGTALYPAGNIATPTVNGAMHFMYG